MIISNYLMMSFDQVFNSDLFMFLVEFLNDKETFRLFSVNKFSNKIMVNNKNKLYYKTSISCNQLDKYNKYKIINYYIEPNDDHQMMPQTVKNLTFYYFGHKFNKLMNYLPSSLTSLRIINGYFNNIDFSNVRLKSLTMSCANYNNFRTDILPSSLTYLSLSEFNENVDSLPENLETLKLMLNFDKSIDYLPKSLKTLHLGMCFNQPVDNLPSSLTSISFDGIFNQTVDKLPSSLTSLSLGHKFNKSIDNLPSSLIRLNLGFEFNQRVDKLPESLQILCFGMHFNQPVDNLPKDLKVLILNPYFNQPIDNLPDSLIELKFDYFFNHNIVKIPKNLKTLKLHQSFNKEFNVSHEFDFLLIPKKYKNKLTCKVKHLCYV